MNAGKLFQRNITGLVPLFDELREVFVNDAVFPIAAQAFEFIDQVSWFMPKPK